MKNRQIHRLFYLFKHRVLTLNNIVALIAAVISLSWIWGSLGMMERNYTLQRNLDRKQQELRLASLEARSLELEQGYLTTEEYQELAVRDLLGKGAPGEKVLILTNPIKSGPEDSNRSITTTASHNPPPQPSNFEQWMDFLFPAKK